MKGLILFLITATHIVCAQDVPPPSFKKPDMTRTSIAPFKSLKLGSQISEGSGLVFWNGLLWTHNDSNDSTLYSLDTISGKI